MVRNLGDTLGELVVVLVDGLFFLVGGFGDDDAVSLGLFADCCHDLRIVCYHLGDDVQGALQGFFRSVHFLFRIHEGCSEFQRISLGVSLRVDLHGQRFQAFLLSLGGAGRALLLVGLVKVFDPLKDFGLFDLGLKFLSEFTLLVDQTDDLSLAVFEAS